MKKLKAKIVTYSFSCTLSFCFMARSLSLILQRNIGAFIHNKQNLFLLLGLLRFTSAKRRRTKENSHLLQKIVLLSVFLLFNCYGFSGSVTSLIIEPDQQEAPIIDAINHAQHSIDLVMYGFTDRKIRNAMLDANKRGVTIRVILEKEPYLSENENTATLKVFEHYHIDIKRGSKNVTLTHQKTLVIDGQEAWIMTMNFTRSAFTDQRNFAILVTSKPDVNEIETIFNNDWQDKKMPIDFQPNLIWSPINSRAVINNLILNAHSSLDIYAPELSDYQIIGSLAKAADHGVSVNIIMPQSESSALKNKLTYLTRHHIHIFFSKNIDIHAKMILADSGKSDQAAYLGSANLTTASLDQNRELGIIIRNPVILKQINGVFNSDKKI